MMTKVAHTEGPWHQDKWGSVKASSGESVKFGALTLSMGHSDEIRANDQLVAAAPTLLMALEFLLDQAESFNVSGVYFNQFRENRDALDTARDAIAKATERAS